MKIIDIKLPTEMTEAKVYLIGDTHIGDRLCDYKLLQKVIAEIANTPNAFCVLNGDILDNAIVNSVGDVYENEQNPSEQIQTAIRTFEPIKDKILVITEGNHENRTYKTTGIQLNYQIASKLGIEGRYSSGAYLIFLSLGNYNNQNTKRNGGIKKVCYSIYGKHGAGGGRKVGAKANKLDDMSTTCDADIFVHSHTHTPIAFKKDFIKVDMQNRCTRQVTQLMVNGNAFLDFGGYGEAFGYSPSSKAVPVLLLDGIYKNARVIL